MTLRDRCVFSILAALLFLAPSARGEEKSHSGPACGRAIESFFADEVWAKVGAQSCLTCHKAGGDAEESKFVLRDPKRSQGMDQEL